MRHIVAAVLPEESTVLITLSTYSVLLADSWSVFEVNGKVCATKHAVSISLDILSDVIKALQMVNQKADKKPKEEDAPVPGPKSAHALDQIQMTVQEQ